MFKIERHDNEEFSPEQYEYVAEEPKSPFLARIYNWAASKVRPVVVRAMNGVRLDRLRVLDLKMGENTIVSNSNSITSNTSLSVNAATSMTLATTSANNNITLNPDGTGVVDVSTARITNVGDPTGGTDAANRNFVSLDNAIDRQVALATPATVGAAAALQIELEAGAGIGFTDDNLDFLFTILEDSAGGNSAVQVAADVDSFLSAAVRNTFTNDGLKVDAGNTTIIHVGSTDTNSEGNITSSGFLQLNSGGATDISLNPGGNVNVSSARITNVDSPVDGTDAVNKNYVDAIAQGLDVKNSVRLSTVSADLDTELAASTYYIGDNAVGATRGIQIAVSGIAGGPFTLGETITESVSGATATLVGTDSLSAPTVFYLGNIGVAAFTGGETLTGGTSGATVDGDTVSERTFIVANAAGLITSLTLDGVAPAADNRLLVKNQTAATQNGIYVVEEIGSASVPWVLFRAEDQDGSPANEVSAGNFTFVELGTANEGTGWVVLGDGDLVLDTDDIDWTQFSGAGSVTAGDGLSQSGSTINLGNNGTGTFSGLAIGANTVAVALQTNGGLAFSANEIVVDEANVDHNTLNNLATGDVHTQYALLAGRSGGQSLIGGTAANEDLTLESTSNATKGFIQVASGSDIRMMGDDDWVPNTDTQGKVGTSALRFGEVNAVTITSGDHVFKHPTNGGHYRMTEHPEDGLMIKNEKTGKWYKIPLVECDAPSWE